MVQKRKAAKHQNNNNMLQRLLEHSRNTKRPEILRSRECTPRGHTNQRHAQSIANTPTPVLFVIHRHKDFHGVVRVVSRQSTRGVSGWLGSCPWGLVLRAARCPCAGSLAGVGDGAPVRKHDINWGWGEGSEEVGERNIKF